MYLKTLYNRTFIRQAALYPLREFHRFADALTELLDPYLPGFPGGTVSKFDSADLRTLLGSYGTTNLAENINNDSKSLFAYVRTHSRTKDKLAPLVDKHDELRWDGRNNANILNNSFC